MARFSAKTLRQLASGRQGHALATPSRRGVKSHQALLLRVLLLRDQHRRRDRGIALPVTSRDAESLPLVKARQPVAKKNSSRLSRVGLPESCRPKPCDRKYVITGGAESGNIVLALVVVIALLLGTLALLQRASGSNLGSFFSSKGRGSRDAAEYGIKYLVSELALSRNRKLSVIGESPSQWATLSTAVVVNPCEGAATRPAANIISAATSMTAVPGSTNKKFFLKSISFKNDSSSGARNSITFARSNASSAFQQTAETGTYKPSAINLSGESRGYLVLTVIGQETGPLNSVLSSTEITREFEVVPKCCQRSFGYTFLNTASPQPSHGNDLRSCPAFGLGNLNLVIGGNGDGIFSANGKSYDLWKNSIGNPQDIAITLNPNDEQQLSNDQDTSLVYTSQELPEQINTALDSPAFAGSACISGNTPIVLPRDGLSTNPVVGNCTSSTVTTPEAVWQLQGNASGTGQNRSCVSPAVLGSDLPSGAILVDSQNQDLGNQSPNSAKCYLETNRQSSVVSATPYCEVFDSQYYCLIRYIDNGPEIQIDSSGGKVNLLFYDAVNTATNGNQLVQGGSVSFAGGVGTGFRHCTSIAGGSCTDAGIQDADNFSIYSNILGSSFELKGATGALSGFFDLRYSDVDLRGGGSNSNINLSGILWVNNLDLSGNLTLVNPPSGPCSGDLSAFPAGSTCAILAARYPELFNADATDDSVRPAFDWIPRSVFTSTMY